MKSTLKTIAIFLSVLILSVCLLYVSWKVKRWFNWKLSYGPMVEERIENLEKRIEKLEKKQ